MLFLHGFLSSFRSLKKVKKIWEELGGSEKHSQDIVYEKNLTFPTEVTVAYPVTQNV